MANKLFTLMETSFDRFDETVRTYLSKTFNSLGYQYTHNQIFGIIYDGIKGIMQNAMFYIEDALTEQNVFMASRKKSIYSLAKISGYEPFYGSAAVGTGVYAGQQERKKFALCYTTRIGSEAEEGLGYKIHILYGCKASPSERAYATVNDSPEPITFSWEVTTSPVPVTGHKDTALITIDSRTANGTKLTALEQTLFGTPATTGDNPQPATPATLLMPDAIIAAMAQG